MTLPVINLNPIPNRGLILSAAGQNFMAFTGSITPSAHAANLLIANSASAGGVVTVLKRLWIGQVTAGAITIVVPATAAITLASSSAATYMNNLLSVTGGTAPAVTAVTSSVAGAFTNGTAVAGGLGSIVANGMQLYDWTLDPIILAPGVAIGFATASTSAAVQFWCEFSEFNPQAQ